MRISIVYTAVTNGPLTENYCARFAATFREFPPGVECEIVVACNGGPLPKSTSLIFSGMSAKMFPRVNDPSWDLGGYFDAARGPCADADMLLCLGESNYFHKEGWLKRLVDAWENHGPGMYGPFASNVVRAHLQTTAFCCSPTLLKQYPIRVCDKASRYALEHGEQSLWRRTAARGMPVRLVTWDGDWEPRMWRKPPNILWRGDQSNCLWWSNHTDRYRDADSKRKLNWARSADRPFA